MAGFLENVGNMLETGMNNPALIPAMATAYQQWNQADKYHDSGMAAAERSDPFGKYRQGYGDMLQGLYQDPSRIAETPGYKFTMDQTMSNTASKLASMGLLGSSQMQNMLADRAAGLASQTWDKEADRLGRFAGAQFDPGNAGRLMMEGDKLQMDAQSNALGAMMYPFGPAAANRQNGGVTNPGRPGSGGAGSGGGNPYDLSKMNPAQLSQLGISQVAPGLFRSASGVFFGGDGQILPDDSMYPITNTTDIPLEPFNPSPNDIFTPGDDYGYDNSWWSGGPEYSADVMPSYDDMSGWSMDDFGGGGGFDFTGGWG